MQVAEIKKTIREIPDYPKPGITFYDVSTLFRDASAFRKTVDCLAERFSSDHIDALAGIESRGFILASAMAYRLGLGLIMVRKQGKLPRETEGQESTLEYGTDRLEVHSDAVTSGERVVVIDDMLATGGTAAAAAGVLERLGADVQGYGFMVELKYLNGRKKLGSKDVFALIHYD